MMQHKRTWSIAVLAILLLTVNNCNMNLRTVPLPKDARVVIEQANNIQPKYVVKLNGKSELELVMLYTSLTKQDAEERLREKSWEAVVTEERGTNVKIP